MLWTGFTDQLGRGHIWKQFVTRRTKRHHLCSRRHTVSPAPMRVATPAHRPTGHLRSRDGPTQVDTGYAHWPFALCPTTFT